MPLKTPALAEAELTYSPPFHQPDVLLCAPQDCPYAQCSRTYRHSAEYKPKNSCPGCFLLSRLTEIPTSSTYRFGALRPFEGPQGRPPRQPLVPSLSRGQGERKFFFQRGPLYSLQTLKSLYLNYSPSVIAEPRPSLLFLSTSQSSSAGCFAFRLAK